MDIYTKNILVWNIKKKKVFIIVIPSKVQIFLGIVRLSNIHRKNT